MTAPALREAARAIVLDPDDRVMLLRYDENPGFWATPGGSLEPGETPSQAVIRELREELGVRHVDLGPHLATRTSNLIRDTGFIATDATGAGGRAA